MNGEEIRVAELFAGIGGFRLGLEKASNHEYARFSEESESEERRQGRKRSFGESATLFQLGDKPTFRVVWANEWDKYASQIYRKNFGEKELFEGDITKVSADDIPEFDLLCAGFPCQPFSLAGKREGFKDIRGTMFFEIARIAEAKKPGLLLLENVKGLLSHADGDTFETIIRTLDELGYDVEWQVFNSKYFGVPQNRERVFIIGHLRGTGTRQIFPITGDGAKDNQKRQVAGCLQGGGHSGGLHSNMTGLVSKSVRSGGRGSLDRHSWDLIQLNDDGGHQVNRVYSVEGLSPTVPTACDGGHIPKIAQALQTDGFLRQGSSFGTDKPQSSRNIRRLTPVECERLQGFPDGYTEGVSDTQRYKCLGNAVTVNVIKFFGEKLLEVVV